MEKNIPTESMEASGPIKGETITIDAIDPIINKRVLRKLDMRYAICSWYCYMLSCSSLSYCYLLILFKDWCLFFVSATCSSSLTNPL